MTKMREVLRAVRKEMLTLEELIPWQVGEGLRVLGF